MIDPLTDEHFMKKALLEAELALEKGEVPVGVVVVAHGQIIARGHNLTETLTDVTAHAEMQAITAAANFIGGKYLKDCTLYVTLEPCSMCESAIFQSRIQNVFFGAYNEKFRNSLKKICENYHSSHSKYQYFGGFKERENIKILRSYFKNLRN